MKIKSLFLISLILISFFLLLATPVLGESSYTWEVGIPGLAQRGESKSVEAGGFTIFAKILIKWAFRLAGILAFAMIIFAGFEYAVFSGAPAKQKDAQNRIINAIVGLLLLFGFWLILNTINPDILKTKDPTLTGVDPSVNVTLNKFITTAKSFAIPYCTKTNNIEEAEKYQQFHNYRNAVQSIGNSYPLASCDVYVGAAMRKSGLDPNYPMTYVPTQYNHIESRFECFFSTLLDRMASEKYRPKNGDILFVNTDNPMQGNLNHNYNHTAIWIDGAAWQASLDTYFPTGPCGWYTGYTICRINK